MKETTRAARPPCFEKWCKRVDDLFTHKAKKESLGTIEGDDWVKAKEKTSSKIAENAVDVTYHR